MKFYEAVLFALTICLLLIGLHQTYLHGFVNSYWIFMLMITIMIIYKFRQNKLQEKEEAEKDLKPKNKPVKKKK